MKLVVGLGNPGEQYERTRHNTGFLVVDELARVAGLLWQIRKNCQLSAVNPLWPPSETSSQFLLAKPQTFMNKSGAIVRVLLKKYKIGWADLLVIHDDLDLKVGSLKLRWGKGPRQHHGVLSIEEALGTKDFWRLRVGIENRAGLTGSRIGGEEYVLSNFTTAEFQTFKTAVLPQALSGIKNWLLKSESS